MPEELKELACRDLGVDCDHVARATTELEVIEQCAAHVAEQHGVHSFPPKLWMRVRRSVRTVQG